MSQFAPLFTIESKNVTLKSLKQADGLVDKMKVSIPFECFYFNTSLNFFEPFIEKTGIDISVDKTMNLTNILKVDIKELLNINFSIAFYDSLFNFMSCLKLEKQIYEQAR